MAASTEENAVKLTEDAAALSDRLKDLASEAGSVASEAAALANRTAGLSEQAAAGVDAARRASGQLPLCNRLDTDISDVELRGLATGLFLC